jgi:DNA polymerase-1
MCPDFRDDILFFDPIIGAWFQNTEIFLKPQIIEDLALFGPEDEYFTAFIQLYNNMDHLEWIFSTEMPHLRLLGRMHRSCFFLDSAGIRESKSQLISELSALEKQIFQLAGRDFNILSPFEVSETLFGEMKLPVPDSPAPSFSIDSRHRVTKHREFAPTSSAILDKVDHPIVPLILQYRSSQKLASNWLSLDEKCDAGGTLHPDFHATATATGRISTSNPNLQNIPLNARHFFSAGEDRVLISLDYCQLELRILAHFSRDAHLCALCKSADFDLHTHIAKLIFSVANATDRQREEAKQSVYATIYGKGWSKDGLEMGQKLEAVLDAFPAIREFAVKTTATATKSGYVETLSGKRRRLPNLNSDNPANRKRDQRMAINTIIQGSAADFVKFALVKIMSEMGDRDLEPMLQLHDEWIFRTNARPGSVEFGKLIERLTRAADATAGMGIVVPIPCKIKWGMTYGDVS